MSNIGSSKIAEMYVGSTKIGTAYLGSTKVYEGASPTPSYSTTVINGVEWTNELINIDDVQGGIYQRTVTLGSDTFTVYFYNYSAAVRIANSLDGWRMPTYTEANGLISFVGNDSTTLKSTQYWSNPGTNTTNFNAIPYGMVDHGRNSFGSESTYWNIGPNDSSYRMYITNWGMSNGSENGSNYAYPLRLVKDA